MADEQDRGVRFLREGEDIEHYAAARNGVEPRRGFVEDQRLRLHREHARERRAALLPARKLEGRRLKFRLGQPRELRRLRDAAFYLLVVTTHVARAE